MPTYEYACSNCGNAWEEIQKITEPAVEVCPACHQATAKRQISGGTFILKGGGWYSDLYSSTPKSGGDSSKSSGSSGEGGKSESKADAPAEAKSTETKKDSGSSSGGSGGGSGGGSSAPSKAAAE